LATSDKYVALIAHCMSSVGSRGCLGIFVDLLDPDAIGSVK